MVSANRALPWRAVAAIINVMKIYTRTGDDGTTGLIGNVRISKADLRIECMGTVDELNAHLGLAECGSPQSIRPLLQQIQHELFNLGAQLAAPDAAAMAQILPPFNSDTIDRLEREIDDAQAQTGPLNCFILPGGGESAARLHVARAVARRAERGVVALSGHATLNPLIGQYLNRLADWLFAYARLANHLGGNGDVAWKK